MLSKSQVKLPWQALLNQQQLKTTRQSANEEDLQTKLQLTIKVDRSRLFSSTTTTVDARAAKMVLEPLQERILQNMPRKSLLSKFRQLQKGVLRIKRWLIGARLLLKEVHRILRFPSNWHLNRRNCSQVGQQINILLALSRSQETQAQRVNVALIVQVQINRLIRSKLLSVKTSNLQTMSQVGR